MRKIFLPLVAFFYTSFLFGQNYEAIRNLGLLNQFAKARADLDSKMSDPKFNSKPEAYILKVYIYSGLANDPKIEPTAESMTLLGEADAAFQKYKQMDPTLKFVTDDVYQNGVVNLYSAYYRKGYADYSDKKWQQSFDKIVRAVEYSDLLIGKKVLNASLDTNVLIIAGVVAENSNHTEEAIKYYSRLADNRVSGEGFESVYRYLVSKYFGKGDLTLFEKYKALGKELYPTSEFFSYDKIDFAIGLETDPVKKIQAVEALLASDPNNFKANEVLGEVIYDMLNPAKDSVSIPANKDELEKKMVAAFTKAAAAEPKNELPYLFMGGHFINKAAKLGEERDAFAADLKKRTKPGVPVSKEDKDKQNKFDKSYGDALELARDPYEKAAAIMKDKANITNKEKVQYKKAVSYLSDIAAFKLAVAKANKSPDAAKWEAEQKKWDDLYDSIKL